MKIKEKLKKIFVDLFDVEASLTNNELNINTISSWDSLNHLNLMITIESKFGIEISPDDFPDLYSDFETILDFIYTEIGDDG